MSGLLRGGHLAAWVTAAGTSGRTEPAGPPGRGGGHRDGRPSQGLSFPIRNMGAQTSPPRLSLHILTPKSNPQSPEESAFLNATRGALVGDLRARRPGEEGQFQDDLGDLSPCLTRPTARERGRPAPGRALGGGAGGAGGASGCCSALGPQGGRGAQAWLLPAAPLSPAGHLQDASAEGSVPSLSPVAQTVLGLCPSPFGKAP